jgi:hypothetical protein
VARYRDRHQVSGAKSDAGEAKLLADLVRTDRHNHRPMAGDSSEAEAIKVPARGHQNLIWARTGHTNALRSALREYYPAALEAFDDLQDRDALAVLGRAPTPTQAAHLSLAKIRSALKHAGRQRNIDARAQEIVAALRAEQLTAPPAVTAAFAATTRAAVGQSSCDITAPGASPLRGLGWVGGSAGNSVAIRRPGVKYKRAQQFNVACAASAVNGCRDDAFSAVPRRAEQLGYLLSIHGTQTRPLPVEACGRPGFSPRTRAMQTRF